MTKHQRAQKKQRSRLADSARADLIHHAGCVVCPCYGTTLTALEYYRDEYNGPPVRVPRLFRGVLGRVIGR